jgi:hypothetical protein
MGLSSWRELMACLDPMLSNRGWRVTNVSRTYDREFSAAAILVPGLFFAPGGL